MLTDDQKSLVGNYDKLTDAEETYEALKNQANSKEERLFSFFSALAEFLQYFFTTVLPQLFKMGR